MVDCVKRKDPVQAPPQAATQQPASPTLSEAETLYSGLSNDSDARTVVAPDLISKYEMNFWYHGVSGNPPKLMWRSDLETNPFPIPRFWGGFGGRPYATLPLKSHRPECLWVAHVDQMSDYRRSTEASERCACDEGSRVQAVLVRQVGLPSPRPLTVRV